jgi:1,4-dihydroxy-2-naphthoate octaprenyltransferase
MPRTATVCTPREVRAAWIEATRPRTLPLAAAGSVVAAGLAAAAGEFRWAVFVLMFVTSVLLQVIANFADDYGDLSHGLDDETRVGPKRGLQRGVITLPQMRLALVLACAAALVCGVALIAVAFAGGPAMAGGTVVAAVVFVLLGLASIAAAIFYTMGSHPYGYIGLGDVMSFAFFGVVAVVGGSFLYLHAFTWASLVAAVALGCPVMAVMNVNNMRDAKRDAAKGKRTVANMLGDPAMRVYETVLLALGAVLYLGSLALCGTANPVSYVLVVVACAVWARVLAGMWKTLDPEKFDRFMAPTSMGTVLVTLAWLVGVLLG